MEAHAIVAPLKLRVLHENLVCEPIGLNSPPPLHFGRAMAIAEDPAEPEEPAEPPIPETLYHYTSNIGLVGILTRGEIWMSDPRFLNDAQEWHQAAAIVQETIEHYAAIHRPAWIARGVNPDGFDYMVQRMLARFDNLSARAHFPARDSRTTPFIFSLSEDGDSLSQWRAYGKGEYSIGFDGERMRAATNARLHHVRYRDVGVDRHLAPYMEQYFTGHLRHILPDGGIDTEVRNSGAEDFEPRLRDIDYFGRIKHPGFQEEREWRLIKPLGPRDEQIFFDPRGRYPIPCARVRVFNSLSEHNGIIKEVICGPGADKQRAAYTFEMVAQRWGAHIPLRYSSIPYRNH